MFSILFPEASARILPQVTRSFHLLAEVEQVSSGVTFLFALILISLIACLALEEKLHAKKSVIAGSFAIICLLLGTVFGILPFEEVVIGSHEVDPDEVVVNESEATGDEGEQEEESDATPGSNQPAEERANAAGGSQAYPGSAGFGQDYPPEYSPSSSGNRERPSFRSSEDGAAPNVAPSDDNARSGGPPPGADRPTLQQVGAGEPSQPNEGNTTSQSSGGAQANVLVDPEQAGRGQADEDTGANDGAQSNSLDDPENAGAQNEEDGGAATPTEDRDNGGNRPGGPDRPTVVIPDDDTGAYLQPDAESSGRYVAFLPQSSQSAGSRPSVVVGEAGNAADAAGASEGDDGGSESDESSQESDDSDLMYDDSNEPYGDEGEVQDDTEAVHLGGEEISMPVYIPAIDWGVIAIILGSSLFVDVTSKSGLFTWIAIKVTKATGGDPLRLLVSYGLMTVVFSAVLNNVTAMIIVGSLTAVSLEKLNRGGLLLGFLLVEGLLTNIGGLLTLISSVPNIIVGTEADIKFVEFFQVSAPYVLVATIVTIMYGAWMFGVKSLKTPEEKQEAAALVSGFDENDGIKSRAFFWFGAFMLVAFIATIATTSYLPYISDLQMGFVAMAFAGIMLLPFKSSPEQFYKALDWDLLGFFMALFVVINVMEHAGVLDAIGVALAWVIQLGDLTGTGLVLVASAAFSSVTDNIPLSAMLAKILGSMGTPSDSPLWWSVVFGANLGGNLTPIGSASTLVAVTIIHKHKLELSFLDFVKAAFPFAIIQIVLATIYVLVFLGS